MNFVDNTFTTSTIKTFTLDGSVINLELSLDEKNTPEQLGFRQFIARYQKPRLSYLEMLRARADLDMVAVEDFEEKLASTLLRFSRWSVETS